MIRIAIVGCRPPKSGSDVEEYQRLCRDAAAFIRALPLDVVLVSGGAVGIDAVARSVSRDMGHRLVEHLPDYSRYGIRAPLERNTLIVANSDEVHAWPAPWSRGTWDTVRKARSAGKLCVVHRV